MFSLPDVSTADAMELFSMKEGVARALIVVVVSKETSARYCGLEGGEEACGVGTAAPAVVDFDDTDAGPCANGR